MLPKRDTEQQLGEADQEIKKKEEEVRKLSEEVTGLTAKSVALREEVEYLEKEVERRRQELNVCAVVDVQDFPLMQEVVSDGMESEMVVLCAPEIFGPEIVMDVLQCEELDFSMG